MLFPPVYFTGGVPVKTHRLEKAWSENRPEPAGEHATGRCWQATSERSDWMWPVVVGFLWHWLFKNLYISKPWLYAL